MPRLAPLVIGTLLALSCAAHALPQRAVSAGPCDNGPVQCCDNLTSASALDAPAGYMLRILLGVPVYAILDNVGTGCAPLGGDSASWCVRVVSR